ncbi:unnamed protein product [Alternaria alternata]
MTSSLPGNRDLPVSQYDLGTYWGRVQHSANISDPRTLLTSSASLENAKKLVTAYKTGKIPDMTPELWNAKKIIDSTIHPDGGNTRMASHQPSRVNVGINFSNANKSVPLSTSTIVQSYLTAVSASCGVALGLNALVPRLKSLSPNAKVIAGRLVPFAAVATAGALNVFLMRGEEIRQGIDVYPALSEAERQRVDTGDLEIKPLGKSKKAATLAVGETALSRVLNATPIMVLPPLILVRLQKTEWLKQRPRMVTPVNLGLIFTTSIFALPLALAAFPQRQAISAKTLEPEFHERGGKDGMVEFNRGI